MVEQQWDIAPGTTTTRAEVAGRFGGSTRNGISPSASTPNVMIYSDPTVGRRHGYNFDGWADDGAFYYTGDGQLRDQKFVSGNKAIITHTARGMTLRVFEAVPGTSQKGGKPQRYLGSFRVDPDAPWRREESLDREGEPRTVLVFRLLPIAAETPTNVKTLSDTPATAPSQEFLPPENNIVKDYDVAARKGSTARRREAELMTEVEDFLLARGHKVGRLRLTVPASSVQLLTDTFDSSSGVLYEVKASSTRNMVRVAIGQLFDYRRFTEEAAHYTVVLPVLPAPDLVELVHGVGFELVTRDNGGFVRVTPTGSADLR